MPYGTLAADIVQSSTAGTAPQFNDGNGIQAGTLCRAWVNFVSSSGSISSSYNVSSVTRNSTGDYTVNFTNAMSDNKYSVLTVGEVQNAITPFTVANPNVGGTNGVRSTTQIGVLTGNSSFALVDANNVNVAVFR